MKSSQQEMVLRHLQEHGSLTSREASQMYGIKRLVNCIRALEKMGHSVSYKIVETDFWGEPIEEVVYFLEEED